MRSLTFLFAILGLSSAAAVNLESRQTPSGACNNSPDLCSKPYNQITHLGAHDSPFVRDASTGFSASGNQYYNSTVQLDAGVRLLSGQIHKNNGGWHLCHSSCDLLDAGLLSEWLAEISAWLDVNRNDVVTLLLVNSDDATTADLAQEFADSKITKYAYIPPSKTTAPAVWPTLNDLIIARTRLMVFVASLPSPESIPDNESYLMDEFTFLFENPYSNVAFTDFTCTPDRPSGVQGNTQAAISSNRMPLMNHFLYAEGLFDIQTPDIKNISTTNSPSTSAVGMLGQSAQSCTSTYGKAPTFILVDFFDQGPAITVVDSLNGVTNPVGRRAVPARDVKENSDSRSSMTFAGVSDLVDQVAQGETPSLGAWIWAAGKWSLGGINVSGGDLISK